MIDNNDSFEFVQEESSSLDNMNTSAYKANQIEEELVALRKKDRTKNLIFGLVAGIVIVAGAGFYISNAIAEDYYYDDYAQLSYGAQYAGAVSSGGGCGGGGGSASTTTTGATAISSTTASGSASGGGGCCGGGAGGSTATPESLAQLEKQGLDLYKEENKDGSADVTAKASDRGCHTQIDILDAGGTIVRSYGYQGSALYVIK